ncbi:MAG TPA: hypothetical protein VM492_12890 [Sumerlaeia bacterium]|nr:hypothetical protein [Sumerlaeia bacterium]
MAKQLKIKRFRSAASFGKRQEFVAIAELLRRGFDVYLTLVDDQQIDCVVRRDTANGPRYLDLQIKARSSEAKNPGMFAAMTVRKPRKNFFFIFYSERVNTYWVLPSLELIKEARQNKAGKNAGKYSINFVNVSTRTGEARTRPRFEKYLDKFGLLHAALA